MNLPKNAIITGASALSIHKVISFLPNKMTIEMPLGTNTSSYNDFVITTQSPKTINVGIDKYQSHPIYTIERLFVELDKFPLENTIKQEALRNLEEKCNPVLVKKVYEKLRTTRRGIDHARISDYLSKHYENVIELILETPEHKRKDLIREYLIARVSELDVPVLEKGGSAIELFSSVKRSTYDVDAHSGRSSTRNVLDSLANPKHDIYFIASTEQLEMLNKEKKVYKFSLNLRTSSHKLRKYFEELGEAASVDISFNNTYTDEEIKNIISEFKLTKRKLSLLQKHDCMPFSREMLLAEKFQSLIGKPEDTKRTKDLIDLKLLWEEDIDKNLFAKWFFKKYQNQTHALSPEQAIVEVQNNIDKELVKIKPNFNDAAKMYELDFSFDECMVIYKVLADIVIEK